MKNCFCKFKTEKLSIHDIIYGLMIFEEITINGHTAKVSRRSSCLYHINGIGAATVRPRLSSYRWRQNKRKCIFNYYKPAVNFHDSSSGGNICIRDIGYFKTLKHRSNFIVLHDVAN
jgi:hypothetical protein